MVAANGINEHAQTLQPQLGEKIHRKADDFCIHHWIGAAKHLTAKLMELAITPCLWLVIAEHWTSVIKFDRQRLCKQFVFHKRTHGASRAFRTQRHMTQALIFERIHFF